MQLQLSEQSHKHGSVSFTPCSQEGKPLLLKLQDVVVPFEPGVFGGDGTEVRKSICFANAPLETLQQLTALEKSIGATSSNVKEDMLRCKVNADRVRIWDALGKPTAAPETWRAWKVCAQIQVRGKWETRQGSGLSLEVRDIMFKAKQETTQVCPFTSS